MGRFFFFYTLLTKRVSTGPCSACQIIDAIGQSENSHLLPQNFPGNLDSDIFTYPNAGDIGSIDHFLLDFETQDVGFQYQPFHTGEAAMTNDEHSGLVPTCFDDTPLANAHSDGSIQTAQSLEAGDSDSYGLTTNPYMSSFEYGVAHTTQECTNSTPIPDSLSTSSLTIDGHHQGHRYDARFKLDHCGLTWIEEMSMKKMWLPTLAQFAGTYSTTMAYWPLMLGRWGIVPSSARFNHVHSPTIYEAYATSTISQLYTLTCTHVMSAMNLLVHKRT